MRGNDLGKNSQLVWSVIMERKMEQLLLPLLSLCVFLSGKNNIFSSSYPNFCLLKIALEQSHQVIFGP